VHSGTQNKRRGERPHLRTTIDELADREKGKRNGKKIFKSQKGLGKSVRLAHKEEGKRKNTVCLGTNGRNQLPFRGERGENKAVGEKITGKSGSDIDQIN